MAKGLSYTDAVKILGGSGPLTKVADNLLGGLLSVATAGGSDDPYEDNDDRFTVALDRIAGAFNSPHLGILYDTRVIPGLQLEDTADWFRFQTTATGTSDDFVQTPASESQPKEQQK